MQILNACRHWFYKFCAHCDWISSTLFALLSIVMGIDTKSDQYNLWPKFVLSFLKQVQIFSVWLVIILAVIALFGILFKRLRNPWVWDKLKYVLDGFQKKAYADFIGQREQHHRVTLFRYQTFIIFRRHWTGTWYWPWGKGKKPFDGWLVPVLRSGHKPTITKTVFHAPDVGDSEGVAGLAWDTQTQVIPEEELPRITATSALRQKEKYARRTFTEEQFVELYIQQGKSLPLSVGAMPVFVRGKIWGVLVLDSQASDGVTEEVLSNFSLTVEIIGQLLEKA